MHERIDWVRVETQIDRTIEVTFYHRNGVMPSVFISPSDDSLYRLLNNDQVQDICAYNQPAGLMLEITPK